MGAGKSTLLHQLALRSRLDNWEKRIRWIREPVARFAKKAGPFAGALEKFYTGELKAFAFQSFVFMELLERDLHTSQIVRAEAAIGMPLDALVMDRHFSSCIAFAGVLHKQESLPDFEFELVRRKCNLFNAWGSDTGCFTSAEATLCYLDIDPSLALTRIGQRNRAGEEHISLDYLERLREEQQAEFPSYRLVHKIPIEAETSPDSVCEAVSRIILAEI